MPLSSISKAANSTRLDAYRRPDSARKSRTDILPRPAFRLQLPELGSIIVGCSVHPRCIPLMIGGEYAMQKRQFCGWRDRNRRFYAKLARAKSTGRGIL